MHGKINQQHLLFNSFQCNSIDLHIINCAQRVLGQPDSTQSLKKNLVLMAISSSNIRKGSCIGIDRISTLPDSIISQINSFITSNKLKYAVATSILSTKWRFKWTSIPNLEFDHSLVLHYSKNSTARLNHTHGDRVLKLLKDVCYVNFLSLSRHVMEVRTQEKKDNQQFLYIT